MPLTLKRAASSDSLDNQSPRKKSLVRAISSFNLRSSKSIFGLHQKALSESDATPRGQRPLNASSPRKKRSFIGSIRSKASTTLSRSKRKSHDEVDDTIVRHHPRPYHASTRSRLLPRWDMSLFSRSQPIAIPAGRVPHLISTPEMTLPLQPESHLQLRLRDDLDYGSAKSLSHLPFEALASASDVHDTHPPASAFTFAAPSRAPPARPLPKTETTFENVKQPRDTQRRSDNSSSSEAASSDTSSFMRDKIAGLCSAQYYKGSSEESDVRASDEAVYEWEPTLNDNLMSAQDRKAEAELQYFFSMMHVDDKHDSRIRKRHSSGHSTVEACRMDKLANLTTDLTMHQSKRRREGRVRFALEGVDMQLPGSSSPYISPENPAVQILLPRIRPTSFPPRPPTPADDDVESMNVESSGTDTYKEATMLNPLDFNLALDQSEHESDQLDDAPKVPEHTSGAGDSVARRSLDRIKAPSKERRSRGSDSIETEFEELKDGGVKSVKAIVMDGLRGPKCAKNGAYWHFPNSSLLEVFPEDDEYAPASWGWDTRSMEVKKRAEPESDMLSKVLSSNGPSHESRTKSFAPQRRFADGSLD